MSIDYEKIFKAEQRRIIEEILFQHKFHKPADKKIEIYGFKCLPDYKLHPILEESSRGRYEIPVAKKEQIIQNLVKAGPLHIPSEKEIVTHVQCTVCLWCGEYGSHRVGPDRYPPSKECRFIESDFQQWLEQLAAKIKKEPSILLEDILSGKGQVNVNISGGKPHYALSRQSFETYISSEEILHCKLCKSTKHEICCCPSRMQQWCAFCNEHGHTRKGCNGSVIRTPRGTTIRKHPQMKCAGKCQK